MVLVNIESLVIGYMPMPSVITLCQKEPHEGVDFDLVLPILVGPMESGAIAAALEDEPSERPLTHALTLDLVKSMGGAVSRIVIDRVEGSTFFSTVYLRLPNGMFTRIDARPSDSITLALRSNAPIFVEDEVFQNAGTPRSFSTPCDKRIEMEEFDKFIEQVDPEDFAAHLDNDES